jgi:signal transduction histidine kinase
MKRRTLRARLTLLYGGLFLVAGAALLGVTYLLVRHSLDAQLTAETDARLGALRAEASAGDGDVVLANGDTVPIGDLVDDVRADQERLRDAALDSLLAQGGLALLGVGAVALALGWLVAGRALRPVHTVTETAERIATAGGAGRGLHERIALAGPDDDVRRLAETFNSMIEHLDRSFDGQRRFVANASHELRTPLALNRALVELAVTEPDATDDTKRLGRALLDVNERHERLIDGLLTLADSENAVTERTPVDLAEVAGHVVELAVGTAGRAEGLDVRTTLEPAPTAGDPVLLERLAQNLVENAVRHNEPGGWVAVETGTAPVDGHGDGYGQAVLTVTNTGPTVPAYEVESLFQPFRRLGGERAGPDRGFGLGLSIVRAIATAHDGWVRAEPRPGGGLSVTVTLPVRP